MSFTGGKVATTFRETFHALQKDVLQWFPGHMAKGIRDMQKQLKNVDCIIEVHDARVPVSGHYADYKKVLTGLKPHIFVLNKMDLADMRYKRAIVSKLKEQGLSNVLFTNFKNQQCRGAKKIIPLAKELIVNSDRFNRSQEESYSIMIIGVPNVGKSSLINRLRNNILRKPKATHEGAIAGITRSVLTRIKVAEEPDVFVLDTPGILKPSIRDVHTGMKLALVACLNDHVVGYQNLADYLLFWLNKHKRFEYVEKLGLPGPFDDVTSLLIFIAAKFKRTLKIKDLGGQYVYRPDFKFAAEHFVGLFRKGELGYYCLDQEHIELEPNNVKK